MAENKKAVVTVTRAAWIDAEGLRQTGDFGQEVSLPPKEFERLAAIAAVAAPGSKDAKEVLAEPDEPAEPAA